MIKQRTAILVIALLGVLATFMPWASLPLLGSMPGINNTLGKVSLVLFMVPLIVSLVGDKTSDLKDGLLYAALIPSALASIVDIIQIIIVKNGGSQSRNPFEALVAENLTIGFGLYIAILAGLFLPVFAFLMKDSNKSIPNAEPETPIKDWRKEFRNAEITEKETHILEPVTISIDKEDHSRFMPK